MSEPVDPAEIVRIVGAPRHPTRHIARAVAAEQTVFVLHSEACLKTGNLQLCVYSLALDNGIDVSVWVQDKPLFVVIDCGRLIPDAEGGSPS